MRVGKQVKKFLAVESAHVDVLIEHARGDGQIARRLPQEGNAPSPAVAVVDVVVHPPPFTQGVNEPGILRTVGHHAHGRLLTHGSVEGRLEMASVGPAVNSIQIKLSLGFVHVQLGLIGDVPDGPADGA